MAQVPLIGNPIFVDVLGEGGTIQVQSYPMSELQSILGASLHTPSIVTQAQIQSSLAEAVIQIQPQIEIQIQPQTDSEIQQQTLSQNEPQKQLVLETEATPQQRSGGQQPALEELQSIDIKLEGIQNFVEAPTEERNTATVENKSPRLKCPEDPNCRYTCESQEKLERHVRRHRGENAFQCLYCSYSTYNKCLFEEHVRIHLGVKPFKCSFCPYKSVSKKNTKKHELIHSPSNPRKCDQCDFVARHLKSLDAHKRCEHPESIAELEVEKNEVEDYSKKFYCERCRIQLKNKDLFKRHVKNHRRCLLCGIFFENSTKLNNHKTVVHGCEKKVKKSEPKRDQFKCAYCDWSSSNEVRILLHLIHHPDQEVDPNVADISILRKYGIMA